MRKKVLRGYVADGAYTYDWETGINPIKKKKDTTLKDFEFAHHLGRLELCVPLVTPTRKLWVRCKKKYHKIKITMELE